MRFVLPLLLLLSLFAAPAHAQDKPIPADWTTYRDSATRYLLSHPIGWERKAAEGAMFFLSPVEKHDVFRENVNVVIQDMSSQMMTLDEYTAFSRDQINRMGGVGKVISERKTTLAGFPAMEMVSDFTYEGSATKVKSVFFVRGKAVFLLSYTALPETYEQWEAVGSQVIETMRFEK